MTANASTFTARGMAPALAVELARQINSQEGNARQLMARGMSYVLALLVEKGINSVGTMTRAELTSLGVPPDLAEEIIADEAAAQNPVNTVAPVLSGTPEVGEVLTSTPGTWVGVTPFTYTRRWLRDGEAISGATAASYTLVSADEGAEITVEVKATNSAGSGTALSNALGPVTDPA